MKQDDPLDLPFDQFQRYRLVADLLEQLRGRGKPLSVLDVGGRTALLRRFLTKDEVTLVDVDPSEEERLVLGDGGRLPFRDAAFDVVCAFDTLEHVPPRHRSAFVTECSRVASRWVVLAGPCQAARVVEAEELLKSFLHDKLGIEHRYLNEHRDHGLPDRAVVEAKLRKLGARVKSFGHANLDRWLVLMCLSMYMDDDPGLRGLAKSFHHFYNETLYASDHAPPVYRQVIVAAFGKARLPNVGKLLEPPVAPAQALPGLSEFARELVTFDRERSEWRAERDRLRRVVGDLEKDFAGHRAVLGNRNAENERLERVAADLERDLEGHRAALDEARVERERLQKVAADLEQDLIGHRTSLGQARGELKARAASLRDLTEELEAERRMGEEARAALARDLAGHRDEKARVVQELDATLAAAKVLEDTLERERIEGRKEREALGRDLGGHREVLTKRESELEALRAGNAALESDLEGHKQMVAELKARAAELDEVRSVLERDLDEHRKTLAATREVVGEKDLRIEALEGDVRSQTEAAEGLREQLADSEQREAATAKELAAVESDLEETARELGEARDQLAEAARELTEAHAELGRRTAEVGALQSELQGLREALRSRWGNVKRALSFGRPEA